MIKPKSMLALFALVSFFNISVSNAGNEGGGGGGICIAKRCMTLAQAGLRIDEKKTSEFELEQSVVEEIAKIVKSIPFYIGTDLQSSTIGRKDTFIVVSENQTKDFAKFKKEYLGILKDSKMDSQQFELLAISKDNKTYLLPGFELLDTRGKALLLIHESLIRDSHASVIQALTWDGYLVDFLAASENGTGAAFDRWPMIQILIDMKVLNDDYAKHEFLETAVEKNNNRIDSVCSNRFSGSDKETVCNISREVALSLRTIHPDFAKKLGDTTVPNIREESLAYLKNHLDHPSGPVGEAFMINMIKLCDDTTLKDSLVIVNAMPVSSQKMLVRLDCTL